MTKCNNIHWILVIIVLWYNHGIEGTHSTSPTNSNYASSDISSMSPAVSGDKSLRSEYETAL